jgi:hypothetical protein
MAIHTTLYDLIAALSAEVRPDEEDVLTAAVVHLLNTHRVTCTRNRQGYRLRAFNFRRNTESSLSGYLPMRARSGARPWTICKSGWSSISAPRRGSQNPSR